MSYLVFLGLSRQATVNLTGTKQMALIINERKVRPSFFKDWFLLLDRYTWTLGLLLVLRLFICSAV